MLDINLIRSNQKYVEAGLLKRGQKADLTGLLVLDEQKRTILKQNEEMRATRNLQSKGKPSPDTIKQMKELGDKIAEGDKKLADIESKIFDTISALPNLPTDDVIAGGKESNKVIKTFGTQPKFNFKPRDHVEICTKLGLIDYELGAKMSGSGHWVYKNWGARLEWALLNYFVDFHIQNNYVFIMPPHLLNYESGYAAGQFPKFKDDVFFTEDKSKFLLPTSETALINMHRGETFAEEALPIKYAAYSPCYRKEGGGYGSAERGMIRGHQFNKIEMFAFCTPEQSEAIHTEFVRNAELLVEGLGLHYQTVKLAAGDTGAAMAKTFDIEVWIPSMNGYKEVSSASNGRCYQARRASTRFKRGGVSVFVHNLNASGLATSRLIPAMVEQFQNSDGSVAVPKVLHKYGLPAILK